MIWMIYDVKRSIDLDFSKSNAPSKALKLGGRLKDTENFVDLLKSEGEHVINSSVASAAVKREPLANNKIPASTIATEPYGLIALWI